MGKSKKNNPLEGLVTSATLSGAPDPSPEQPTEVEGSEAKLEEIPEGMTKVALRHAIFINGVQYPAGDKVLVPTDAHDVWKHALK